MLDGLYFIYAIINYFPLESKRETLAKNWFRIKYFLLSIFELTHIEVETDSQYMANTESIPKLNLLAYTHTVIPRHYFLWKRHAIAIKENAQQFIVHTRPICYSCINIPTLNPT